MPFRRWMEIAGGMLGWTESQFWDCSYQYFKASIDGWMEINAIKPTDLSEDEYENFKQENSAYLALSGDDLRRLRENNKVISNNAQS